MIVSGLHNRAVQAALRADVVRIALRRYRDPLRAARAVGSLARLRASVREGRPTPRVARVGGRYFTHLHAPGWPSAAFDHFIDNEFARLDDERAHGDAPDPAVAPRVRLQCVIMAVTRQCPLRCEHCCEWDVLNHDDALPAGVLAGIVERFQARGVTQIHFSGGEPLTRTDMIADIVAHARSGTDFWVLTSGVGLTPASARSLRKAGVTGVCVSLDHWDAQAHNRFRGSRHAWAAVERAAAAAHDAGLVLCLTLCPTGDMTEDDNLDRYAQTAARLGASFIQILEPRPVGHFEGRDVALSAAQRGALERFFTGTNFARGNRRMPIVVYPDLASRHVGCVGAGRRYAYVDTAGELHACPFCRGASGSALDGDLDRMLAAMARAGCPDHRPELDANPREPSARYG